MTNNENNNEQATPESKLSDGNFRIALRDDCKHIILCDKPGKGVYEFAEFKSNAHISPAQAEQNAKIVLRLIRNSQGK